MRQYSVLSNKTYNFEHQLFQHVILFSMSNLNPIVICYLCVLQQLLCSWRWMTRWFPSRSIRKKQRDLKWRSSSAWTSFRLNSSSCRSIAPQTSCIFTARKIPFGFNLCVLMYLIATAKYPMWRGDCSCPEWLLHVGREGTLERGMENFWGAEEKLWHGEEEFHRGSH